MVVFIGRELELPADGVELFAVVERAGFVFKMPDAKINKRATGAFASIVETPKATLQF